MYASLILLYLILVLIFALPRETAPSLPNNERSSGQMTSQQDPWNFIPETLALSAGINGGNSVVPASSMEQRGVPTARPLRNM